MILKQDMQSRGLIMLGLLIMVLLAGCAVKKDIWGDPKTGLILTYRLPENQVFQYQTSNDDTQKLTVMGQVMENKTAASSKFSVQAKGLKEKNLLLGVTIDDMKINISSGMMGNITPDLGAVIGKTFDMTLSPLGKEMEFFGVEELQYDMGMAGKRGIKSSFRNIFPDLAENPLKIGDTWTNRDETTEKQGNMDIHAAVETVNTLKGLETSNGFECVAIEAKTTGTFTGKGQQMGADITFKGNIKGTSTWYFAYKQGVFVRMKTNSTTEGTVLVSAQGMTIPMTSESASEISLIK